MKQEKEIRRELKRLTKLIDKASRAKAHPLVLSQIMSGIACLNWVLETHRKDPWLLLK